MTHWLIKIMRAIRLHPKAHKVYVDTETTGLQAAARIYVQDGSGVIMEIPDPNIEAAAKMFGIDPSEVTLEQRQRAKEAMFCYHYGKLPQVIE